MSRSSTFGAVAVACTSGGVTRARPAAVAEAVAATALRIRLSMNSRKWRCSARVSLDHVAGIDATKLDAEENE